MTKEEYDKTNEDINLFNQNLVNIQKDIIEQEKKLKGLDIDIKNARNTIDTQIMSRAEYDILKDRYPLLLLEYIEKHIHIEDSPDIKINVNEDEPEKVKEGKNKK